MDQKPNYVWVDVKKNVINKLIDYKIEDIQQRTLVSTDPVSSKSGTVHYGQLFTSVDQLKSGCIFIGKSIPENKTIFQNQSGEVMQAESFISINVLDFFAPERIKHIPIPQNILNKLSDADRMKKERESLMNQISQELSTTTTENSLFSNFFKK